MTYILDHSKAGRCLVLALLLLRLPGGVRAAAAEADVQRHAARLERVASRGSALPAEHPLTQRFELVADECRTGLAAAADVAGKAGWEEDTAARLGRLKEAVHRLGLLELRTRVVKAALGRGEREPDYGLLTTPGLERIVNSEVPAVGAENAIELTAAAGEPSSFRMPLIVFDRGISKPSNPSKLAPFVTVEKAFQTAGGEALPDKALTALFEDEAPMDSQRGMFQTVDGARGIQRTDYLTGAAQDCLIGLGSFNYIPFLHANTAHGIRVTLDIPPGQKPGAYRGVIRVWPSSEDYPATATATVHVVDAGPVSPPALRLRGGFNRQAFLYMTGVRQKKSVEELDPAKAVEDHVKLLAREGVDLVAEDAAAPDPEWLFVPDEPDGPLAMTAAPLRVRLLAWQAWATGKKGVQVATVHDWTESWSRITIWPGPRNPRGYNNFVKDMHRIGSLYYATGHKSLRLFMLQEGFRDVAWLTALEAKMESNADPGAAAGMRAVLERARALAQVPEAATVEKLLDVRREAILMLAGESAGEVPPAVP